MYVIYFFLFHAVTIIFIIQYSGHDHFTDVRFRFSLPIGRHLVLYKVELVKGVISISLQQLVAHPTVRDEKIP